MTVQGTPVLIGCAHGTNSPVGQHAVRDLLDAVRLALPGVGVREAYVDVLGPKLADVIADVPVTEEGVAAVVVPLLLAGGYHAIHDIAEAGADVVTPALAPHPGLVSVVIDRYSSFTHV